jgi:hypothetical protein
VAHQQRPDSGRVEERDRVQFQFNSAGPLMAQDVVDRGA